MNELERLRSLVALAVDDRGNREEQKNAAINACRIIDRVGIKKLREMEEEEEAKRAGVVRPRHDSPFDDHGIYRAGVPVKGVARAVGGRPIRTVNKLYEFTETVRITSEGPQFIVIEYDWEGKPQTMYLEREYVIDRVAAPGIEGRVLLTLNYDYAFKAGVTEAVSGRIVNR